MSVDENPGQIIDHPKFRVMVRKRRLVSFTLTFLVVLVYSLFVVLMAYMPETMTHKGWGGEMITSGIAFMVFILFFSVAASWVYTWWANNHFDVLKAELLAELEGGQSEN